MLSSPNQRWLASQAGPKIVQRGKWILHERKVLDLLSNKSVIEGTVRGSNGEIYKTSVAEKGGRLLATCTCPFDWGPVCKHAVALVLAKWEGYRPDSSLVASKKSTRENIRIELQWDPPTPRSQFCMGVRFFLKEQERYVDNIDKILRRFRFNPATSLLLKVTASYGATKASEGFFFLKAESIVNFFDSLPFGKEEIFQCDLQDQLHPLEYSTNPEPVNLIAVQDNPGTIDFKWHKRWLRQEVDKPAWLFAGPRSAWLIQNNRIRLVYTHPFLEWLQKYSVNGGFHLSVDEVLYYFHYYHFSLLEKNRHLNITGLSTLSSPRFKKGNPILELTPAIKDGFIVVQVEFKYDGKTFRVGYHAASHPREGSPTPQIYTGNDKRIYQRNRAAEAEIAARFEFCLKRPLLSNMYLDRVEYLRLLRNISESDLQSRVVIKENAADAEIPRYEGTLEWNLAGDWAENDWFEISPSFITAHQKIGGAKIRKLLNNDGFSSGFWGSAKEGYYSIPTKEIDYLSSVFDAQYDHDKKGSYRLPPYQLFPLYLSFRHSKKEDLLPQALKKRVEENLKSLEASDASLPEKFCGVLRPYQKEGYTWLRTLNRAGLGGILADDMGLGKTVQTLALLSALKESKSIEAPHLIVTPTSVLPQWEDEIKKFTPHLKHVVYAGTKRKEEIKDLTGVDIVLTNYALAGRDSWLLEQKFNYCILDEAQLIKNHNTLRAKNLKAIHSSHRLALSGTPIENRLLELWSLFDFLMPGYLGRKEYFRQQFEVNIEKFQDPKARELLTQRIRPFILRRVKSEVEKDLPPKTEEYLYCELNAAQKALYTEIVAQVRRDVLETIDHKGIENSQIEILTALTKLRQVCCHPDLVLKGKGGNMASAKMEVLLPLMEQIHDEGHKALVFSQFTSMLAIIRAELDQQKVPYSYLDGRTRDRKTPITEFTRDESIPFFLLSLKAGGFGLNLTAADYVIHYDPWWNPAVENQATDRAHRIGQKRKVIVYKLITRETIEEKILVMQRTKQKLSDAILSSQTAFARHLTRETLEELLSIPS